MYALHSLVEMGGDKHELLVGSKVFQSIGKHSSRAPYGRRERGGEEQLAASHFADYQMPKVTSPF